MPRDELIGDVIEVVADNLRLRTDVQNVIARPLDQRRQPAATAPSVSQVWQAIRQLRDELQLC